MTAPTQDVAVEQKPSDKELNFRNLEARYQRQLDQERSARLDAEKRAAELAQKQQPEEEDDSEPYVDHKKLNKTLAKFGQQSRGEIQTDIQRAVKIAQEEAKQEAFLEANPDFYEVLGYAEKLAQKSPALAKSILAMPDNFDRQKLVHQTIKEMGLHKPNQAPTTIQDKIDSNKQGRFYQPTGVGSAPYGSSSHGDYSSTGKKNSYEKMKELQARVRF